MSATATPTISPAVRLVATLDDGSLWEFRRVTAGGMIQLWALGGGASMTIGRERVRSYGRPTVRRELVAADGSRINYSVTEHMLEQGYADRHPGSTVVTIPEVSEVCAYERVMIESGIAEEHWNLLRRDMSRFMNMSADSGRPSDAMRSAVRAFKAGTLTEESFAASRPSGYYPEG